MSTVLDLISHFEELSTIMDTTKVKLTRSSKSLREKNSSRVKRLVAELTDIKRPTNKQKLGTESISTEIKSQTLPRHFKKAKSTSTANETKMCKSVANISIREKECVAGVSVNSIKQKLFEKSKQTVDIEKKDMFGDKVKQKRQQVRQMPEDLNDILEVPKANNSEETIEEIKRATNNSHCEEHDEKIDDILGFNTFDDSEDDNYVTEAYNKEGFELVIVTLEIKRHTITQHEIDKEFKDLINSSDYIFHTNAHDSSADSSTTTDTYESGNDEYEKCENGNDEYEKYENILGSSNFLYNSLIPQNSPSSSEKEIFEEKVSSERCTSTYYYCNYDRNTNEQDDIYQNMSNFSTCENVINMELQDALTETSEKKEKIDFLLVEMKNTEQTYISGLRYVVEQYIPFLNSNTPKDLIGRNAYLFGNIEEIYTNAKAFYNIMKENINDADSLAQIFIDSASEFELYPLYSKNKPTADIYFKEFEELIKKRQMDLSDKLGLASYLLTPIQRLGKYVILLEEIQKQLRKANKHLETISAAINVVRNVMRKGNDYIAIDSIKDSPIDLTAKGSFLMRANFTILKPRKFQSVVFLFQNIIVFTEKMYKNPESFKYYESIALSDLSLAKCEDKPNIFNVTNYTKSKRSQSDATFILLAESAKVKTEWTEIIGKSLWSQLEKAKEQQTKLNYADSKHTPKNSASINGTIRRAKKYQTKTKAKSKFYDHHYS